MRPPLKPLQPISHHLSAIWWHHRCGGKHAGQSPRSSGCLPTQTQSLNVQRLPMFANLSSSDSGQCFRAVPDWQTQLLCVYVCVCVYGVQHPPASCDGEANLRHETDRSTGQTICRARGGQGLGFFHWCKVQRRVKRKTGPWPKTFREGEKSNIALGVLHGSAI